MAAIRITGGRARGRMIRGKTMPGVRPTSSRVREALFSMVGHDLTGHVVLDAFGGTGLMGVEAWSRGAQVVVVEKRSKVAAQIRDTVHALGADIIVRVGDVTRCLSDDERFTGVVADPPYATDPLLVLPSLAAACEDWLVYEAAVDVVLPDVVGDLHLDRRRVFGNTALHVYRHIEGSND